MKWINRQTLILLCVHFLTAGLIELALCVPLGSLSDCVGFNLKIEHYAVSNQIKSNQILFKVSNVHLKEKKISKKLFTQPYSITNNNKLYI